MPPLRGGGDGNRRQVLWLYVGDHRAIAVGQQQPAACGAFVPSLIVQALVSSSPEVK